MYTRLHPTLPIFMVDSGHVQLLYTPGHMALVSRDQAIRLRNRWNSSAKPDDDIAGLALSMERQARQAADSWQRFRQDAYKPECLMISLGDRCNADCIYCYNRCRGHDQEYEFHRERVAAAARMVADNCRQKGLPFQLAVHGGGEPTRYWEELRQSVAISRSVAGELQVDWRGYLASNGIFDEEKAAWLAENFDLVGISCDGPPDIQDRQRPLQSGGGSAAIVERNIHYFLSRGTAVRVRATITPWSMQRQKEIVSYLAGQLGVRQIHFEPVYGASHKPGMAFTSDMAADFTKEFLAAQQEAAQWGCALTISSVRLDELHGPYCQFLNQTMLLKPSGIIAPCFFDSMDGRQVKPLGSWDDRTQEIILHTGYINTCRKGVTTITEQCRSCINLYHCTRGCPDRCDLTLDGNIQPASPQQEFRCLVQQHLTTTWLREAAAACAGAPPGRADLAPPDPVFFQTSGWDQMLPLSTRIDVQRIRQQWAAALAYGAGEPRRLPEPAWSKGFSDLGVAAWSRLAEQPGISGDSCPAALSIYIHIPFCDRRCGFCDCYSFPLTSKNRRLEDDYTRALENEARAWTALGNLHRRPVTTVHFGGGTPGMLSPAHLNRAVECCRRFDVNPGTEWALESTTSLLTRYDLQAWRELGFSRLHVGIQTLEDPVRNRLKRKNGGAEALDRLELALQMDYVVSVDMIYGLPGQTLTGFLDSLDRLVDLEIDGFSLYQLQVSRSNRSWLQRNRHKEDENADFLLLQMADQFLLSKGYRKNHFNHYARSRDGNIYYTHPQRGEDLLGLGTSATGCFGHYHYRNNEFKGYISGSGLSRIQGGIEESPAEIRLKPLLTALSSAVITRDIIHDLGLYDCLNAWQDACLLVEQEPGETYVLTANGSWFIGQMFQQAREAVTI